MLTDLQKYTIDKVDMRLAAEQAAELYGYEWLYVSGFDIKKLRYTLAFKDPDGQTVFVYITSKTKRNNLKGHVLSVLDVHEKLRRSKG